MRFYDLSVTIEPNVSEPVPVVVDYTSHERGAEILGQPLGLQPADWPDGCGLTTEHVSLTSHTGTHVDAPLHYGPLCEGVPSKSIEEVPLDWFYRDGVVLRADGSGEIGPVTRQELERELDRIGYRIKPFDIVLIHTGADRLWGSKSYFTSFRGMTIEATDWLISQGVKVIGIDSFGFDPPFHAMLATYSASQDKADLWPTHVFGRTREYCQIERLINLDSLPEPFGFKVVCFPVKVKRGGAGWARVVAVYDAKTAEN